MRRIFALGLMTALLAAAVIPQVQAVNWKPYKCDKFELKYPANWKLVGEGTYMDTIYLEFKGPNDVELEVMVEENSSGMSGIIGDYIERDEDGIEREVLIGGKEFCAYLSFDGPDSMNQIFDEIIRSVKVN